MNNYLSILGFGGHSKVVLDLAKNLDLSISGLYDDNPNTHGKEYNGIKVLGPINSIASGTAVIAIGNNQIRKNIVDQSLPINWKTLIHPSSYVSADVEIGEGTVIMAGAIVQPGAKIGRHCIINTGANIDHDCVVGDFCHIGPNAALSGGVKVGEGSFIGIGSSVIPYITIGKWSTIEAGSAVNQNISDNCNVAGVPAVLNFTTKNK
jgi:sugar O-acyltransferase (sialic acid O-acetyltransferase NeuD family)